MISSFILVISFVFLLWMTVDGNGGVVAVEAAFVCGGGRCCGARTSPTSTTITTTTTPTTPTTTSTLGMARRRMNSNNKQDEDDEDDEPPEVNVADFRVPSTDSNSKQVVPSFGIGRGRSSPSIRKAMGTSSKSAAKVFLCTNCGSESVQWRGKCPTCQEWNTLQEFAVPRSTSGSGGSGGMGGSSFGGGGNNMFPMFGGNSGGSRGGVGSSFGSTCDSRTWLDGIDNGYGGYQTPVSIKDVDLTSAASQRLSIPLDDELNTVLGGGLLKGSLILLGGDPGVGKSTLALQLANQVASLATPSVGIGMGTITPPSESVGPVWYVSGEETMAQIATRAQRLETMSDQLMLLSETNINVLAEQVVQLTHYKYHKNNAATGSRTSDPFDDNDDDSVLPPQGGPLAPSLLIIDSIQTVLCDVATGGSPGGITQVRECMALLLRLAKSTDIPIIVIGHVTKTGDVAGPRMVEHMVDAVLYLEGSLGGGAGENAPYRWLRASKNRFGSTQVVGLYEFADGRLIPNPDLDGASTTLPLEDLEGCAMAVVVEGAQRAMTVEVQALVTVSGGAGTFGKKTVDGGGLSYSRLQLLLAVLQKHCGVFIGKNRDVYVNVVGSSGSSGRSKQSAVALDLAVAMALTSSAASIPVRGDTAFLAQVGLLGELRSLGNLEARLHQAQRMGFSRVVVPGRRFRQTRQYGMDHYECPTLTQAIELGLTAALPKRQRRSKPPQGQPPQRRTSSGKWSKASSAYTSSFPETLDDLALDEMPILDDDDDDGEEGAFL